MREFIAEHDYQRVLAEWRGVRAKIWQFHPSLGRLALQLYRADRPEMLYVTGVSCTQIEGPFSWENCRVELVETPNESGAPTTLLRDDTVGFRLRSRGVGMVLSDHRFDLGANISDTPFDPAPADHVEQLTVFAVPAAREDNAGAHRNWVVRFRDAVPDEWSAPGTETSLNSAAQDAVRRALEARGVSHDRDAAPVVRVIPIDRLRAAVCVRTARVANDLFAMHLVAASAALRALDRIETIEDIQGIPAPFWRLLLGPDQAVLP